MVASIIFICFGFALMSLFIYGKLHKYTLKVTVIKALASSMFVALAVYLFCYKQYPNLGIFIIIGSFFGLLGDILLALKRTAKSQSSLYNYFGLCSFAVGHIIYITGLFINFYIAGHFLVTFLPFIIAIIFSGLIIVFRKYLNLNFGNKNVPTFVYICLVSSLFFSSSGLLIINNFNIITLIMITIGGFFFLTSDLMLCKSYFGHYHKAESAIYTVLYYIAQFLIAFSLFFL